MKLFNRIHTPCIGVCSTGIGDSVCRGCKRFDYEVIRWNSYSEQQKASIDSRLAELLASVVGWRFLIRDVDLLAQQLKLQQIEYADYRDPYCWLYELLRAGAGQIDDCSLYGFKKMPLVQSQSLVDIRSDIDAEFYSLSVGHYERYIVANSKRANCVTA